MTSVFASCCLCFAAYLLLAGSLSYTELGTGAAIAVLAGIWVIAARKTSLRRFAWSRAHAGVWLRQIGRLPGATVRTSVALLGVVVGTRGSGSRADERPFRHGDDDDPAERARRATAVLAAWLAPASYVVRAEPGHDSIRLHGIGRTMPTADAEWLI